MAKGQPTMTRCHFELIAETIAELNVDAASRSHIADRFEAALARTNPNFSPSRFHDAAMGIKRESASVARTRKVATIAFCEVESYSDAGNWSARCLTHGVIGGERNSRREAIEALADFEATRGEN